LSIHEHPRSLWDHLEIAMARKIDLFSTTAPRVFLGPQTYIQLGPGHKLIRSSPGSVDAWYNLDYPEWNADKDPLPFGDGTIHGICTYHSMDHFANPIKVLAEVQRVLRPGGWFVNIVPHYSSELYHTDITHKSQFGVDTWRNIFSTRHYDHAAVDGHTEWKLRIEFNMIMGLTERNTILVTKLIREA